MDEKNAHLEMRNLKQTELQRKAEDKTRTYDWSRGQKRGWETTEALALGESYLCHLFFPLHIARLYINNFLTVQTYTEVQKQTWSF